MLFKTVTTVGTRLKHPTMLRNTDYSNKAISGGKFLYLNRKQLEHLLLNAFRMMQRSRRQFSSAFARGNAVQNSELAAR